MKQVHQFDQHGNLEPPELEQVRKLSRLLDASVPLPGGFRIGVDGIVGLIPGIGDALGAGASLWIIHQAWRLGIPWWVLLRMLCNVGVDALLGIIPLVGDLFDFAWKANRRNVRLVERHFVHSKRRRGGA